jgi:eukaryotic-like serine/threonine-protein kinase
MLDPQASRFWQSTLLSGLMDVQGLTACWEAIVPAKREIAEHLDRRLARQAVQSRALTLWQAQQLLAGRTSGFKVDRYVLLDLIGQGGMGRVYLARDIRLNRRVALKILSPERVNNPRAIARFQREARVGAQLQHENLVRIYDFGESNGRYYLVMEFIEGKTIGTLISEQGPMSPASSVRLVRQVALGLEHAHRKGLIHRDVNPYNILVTRDGTAKLADLGLAIDLADDDRVTREGATVGTFDYVAPEQARHSHSADIRSDIYSLGCTLYHMCAGQVPFPSPSLTEKLIAHQALEPTPLDKLVRGIPPGLAAIVQRMMRKSPDERYATPIQVVEVLEPFAHDRSTTGNSKERYPLGAKSAPEFSAGLPPAVDSKAALAQQPTEAPARAYTGTVAGSRDVEADSVAPTNDSFSSNPVEPVASLCSPVSSSETSDPEFPLQVNLGPEPSLSEGLTRPKPKSTPGHRVSVLKFANPRGRLAPFWLWMLVMLTATILVTVGLLVLVKPIASPPGSTAPALGLSTDLKSRSQADPVVTKLTPRSKQAIVVRNESEYEKEFPADKLIEAVRTANGVRGWVELRNGKPIPLNGDQILDFISGRGPLRMRAAPGTQPVIEIELKDARSWLTTGSAVSLELSGLTFLVNYQQSAANLAPPAVITAAGLAKIERCAFKVAGISGLKGSRAIFSNGGKLNVNRCWFEGFDEAIDIAPMINAFTHIQQTMIVSAADLTQTQGQPLEGYGWGVKLQISAGGVAQAKNAEPHLILEYCTFEGTGLIDATKSPASFPLEIKVNHCAVKAKAVLAYKPTLSPSSQVHWQGEGNQYDIHGPFWIVPSAGDVTPAFSSSVTDLKSWMLFAPGDNKPIPNKLVFLTDPELRAKSLQPHDFAIKAPDPPLHRPGADPERVGPWTSQ